MDAILAINAGSATLKVAAFDARTLARLRSATIDVALHADHDAALAAALDAMTGALGSVRWVAIGHRVANGLDATGPRLVDDAVFAELAGGIAFAPLHQPHNLAGIVAARRLAPAALQVACFDTAFHRTIPEVARRYALPRALGIRAFGYHGLSYEFIASVLPAHLRRVVVAHLGSGASLCAMRDRVSIATTMGQTPLDGLPMATRCGALDPGVVLYLIEQRGMTAGAVRELLYERSGLLGISGTTGDMRALLATPDRAAGEAVELFIYRTACAIGALAVALGGLDAVVFTGGIGEHSAEIRERISANLAWLGGERLAIATDEELAIARHVAGLVAGTTVATST